MESIRRLHVLASIPERLAMLVAAALTALAPAQAVAPLTASAIRDAAYGLSISKSADRPFQDPGGPVTYRIVVANGGLATVRGATLADDVPAAITVARWTISAEGGASSSVAAGRGNRFAVPVVLPAGGRVTAVLEGVVADGTAGVTIVNRATVQLPSRTPIAGGVVLSSPPVTVVVPEPGRDLDWADATTRWTGSRGAAGPVSRWWSRRATPRLDSRR
jgi:uncharacterized repeat protein (TIGR01451 family)